MLVLRIVRLFGISKFNSSKDYYKILDVRSTASQSQIKKAYHLLAKKYHPDANSGQQQKFKQVNQAYQILSEQDTKRQYDQQRSYSSESSKYTRSNYNEQKNKNRYRGYQRQEGWRNEKFRQQVMQQILRQQQRNRYKYQQQKRHNYERIKRQKFNRQAQNIRKHNPQMNIKPQQIKKAYQQQQKRRQRQFQDFKDRQKIVNQIIQKKVQQMAQGLKNNIQGFKRVGNYVKSFWENINKKK